LSLSVERPVDRERFVNRNKSVPTLRRSIISDPSEESGTPLSSTQYEDDESGDFEAEIILNPGMLIKSTSAPG